MAVSRIVFSAVSLIGAGGIGFFGVYEGTKKTISDGLGGRKIPKSGDLSFPQVVWSNMLTKLLESSKIDTSPQTDRFINFEDNLEDDLDPHKKLENLCQKVSQETYFTIFETNHKLMDDVKIFCTINIESASLLLKTILLKTSKEGRGESKETFKKKLTILKKDNENLVDSLKEVKRFVSEKKEDEENDWKELADWCDKSYKLSFFHEKDPLWIQVKKYCKKPPTKKTQ